MKAIDLFKKKKQEIEENGGYKPPPQDEPKLKNSEYMRNYDFSSLSGTPKGKALERVLELMARKNRTLGAGETMMWAMDRSKYVIEMLCIKGYNPGMEIDEEDAEKLPPALYVIWYGHLKKPDIEKLKEALKSDKRSGIQPGAFENAIKLLSNSGVESEWFDFDGWNRAAVLSILIEANHPLTLEEALKIRGIRFDPYARQIVNAWKICKEEFPEELVQEAIQVYGDVIANGISAFIRADYLPPWSHPKREKTAIESLQMFMELGKGDNYPLSKRIVDLLVLVANDDHDGIQSTVTPENVHEIAAEIYALEEWHEGHKVHAAKLFHDPETREAFVDAFLDKDPDSIRAFWNTDPNYFSRSKKYAPLYNEHCNQIARSKIAKVAQAHTEDGSEGWIGTKFLTTSWFEPEETWELKPGAIWTTSEFSINESTGYRGDTGIYAYFGDQKAIDKIENHIRQDQAIIAKMRVFLPNDTDVRAIEVVNKKGGKVIFIKARARKLIILDYTIEGEAK